MSIENEMEDRASGFSKFSTKILFLEKIDQLISKRWRQNSNQIKCVTPQFQQKKTSRGSL